MILAWASLFNNGRKSTIFNLIELKFVRACPSLKQHVLY